MKSFYSFLIIGLLGIISVNGQEIIPFPDLSEHYQFRNSGGESIQENPYEHLDSAYQKALEDLDNKIAVLKQEMRLMEKPNMDRKQEELQTLQSKRAALLKEAELQTDLMQMH